MKIFLGGTTAGDDYRKDVIPVLIKEKVNFFNPVVDDWTPEAKNIEDIEKEMCDTHLFVITKDMSGVYSIAELVDSAYSPKNTIIFFKLDGFSKHQIKSFEAIKDLLDGSSKCYNTYFLDTLDDLPFAIKFIKNIDSINNTTAIGDL